MMTSGGWVPRSRIGAAIERVPPAPRTSTEAGEASVFGWIGERRVERRLGVGMVVLGLVVAVPFTPGLVEELQLIGTPMELTSGVVVDATGLEYGRRRNGRRFRVEFDYEVAGKQRRATGYGGFPTDDPPRPGDPIDLSYAPRRPGLARPTGGSVSWLGLPTLTFWAIFLAGFTLWGRAGYRRARTERAWVQGVPVPGRIVKRREKPLIGVHGGRGLGLSYTYDFGGWTYESELSHHDVARFAKDFPSDEVVVLVDPRAPSWSALWPENG
jgi:hypothetical protein